jgi:hypothetical protein
MWIGFAFTHQLAVVVFHRPQQNNDKVDQTSSRNGLADHVSVDSLPSSTPSTTKKLSRFKASKINQDP